MSIYKVSQKFKAIYENLDFDKLEELFSEDFISHGTHMPAPMSQAQFVGFLKILYGACPNMNFKVRVTEISEHSFKMAWQLSGTHRGIFKLSGIGMPDFEPTNRSFSLPEDVYSVTVDGDKISKIFIDPVEGGGIQGVLAQLGLI
jgi:SnoaL-like polyketide cyclase